MCIPQVIQFPSSEHFTTFHAGSNALSVITSVAVHKFNVMEDRAVKIKDNASNNLVLGLYLEEYTLDNRS